MSTPTRRSLTTRSSRKRAWRTSSRRRTSPTSTSVGLPLTSVLVSMARACLTFDLVPLSGQHLQRSMGSSKVSEPSWCKMLVAASRFLTKDFTPVAKSSHCCLLVQEDDINKAFEKIREQHGVVVNSKEEILEIKMKPMILIQELLR